MSVVLSELNDCMAWYSEVNGVYAFVAITNLTLNLSAFVSCLYPLYYSFIVSETYMYAWTHMKVCYSYPYVDAYRGHASNLLTLTLPTLRPNVSARAMGGPFKTLTYYITTPQLP